MLDTSRFRVGLANRRSHRPNGGAPGMIGLKVYNDTNEKIGDIAAPTRLNRCLDNSIATAGCQISCIPQFGQ